MHYNTRLDTAHIHPETEKDVRSVKGKKDNNIEKPKRCKRQKN